MVGLVFGWFVDGLVGLWLVWPVCGWFRVLQLTTCDHDLTKEIKMLVKPRGGSRTATTSTIELLVI